MPGMDASTAVSLVFAKRPTLTFATFVADMDEALRDAWSETYRLNWDQDRLVVFEVDSSRVVLAQSEPASAANSPTQEPALTLLVSIGPGSTPGLSTQIADNRDALLRAIVARYQATFPTSLVLWSEFRRIFLPSDALDLLALAAEALDQNAANIPHDPIPTCAHFDAPEVERLMQRLEGQIAPRAIPVVLPRTVEPTALELLLRQTLITSAEPKPVQTQPASQPQHAKAKHKSLGTIFPELDVANDIPDLPHPMVDEMHAIRAALYPDDHRSRRGLAPLPQRLTVYTLNTTLMLVALPVGSAILVYNLLRGEDLNASARTIAYSSTFLGIAQFAHLQGLLHLV